MLFVSQSEEKLVLSSTLTVHWRHVVHPLILGSELISH